MITALAKAVWGRIKLALPKDKDPKPEGEDAWW
jgi:hypothetical protein